MKKAPKQKAAEKPAITEEELNESGLSLADVDTSTAEGLAELESEQSDENFVKLRKDIRKQAQDMAPGSKQARLLVDHYWTNQRRRLSLGSQAKAVKRGKSPEANGLLVWLEERSLQTELEINTLMREFANNHPLGQWIQEKPVRSGVAHGIAATLLAYVDPHRAPTQGHVWAIFGYDPNKRWLGISKAREWVAAQSGSPEEILQLASVTHHRCIETLERMAKFDQKGKKIKLDRERVAMALSMRPWNPKLKTLGYIIGSCMIKAKNATYVPIYEARKAYETACNERGEYAWKCDEIMAAVPNHAQSAWYSGCYSVDAARKMRSFQAEMAEKKKELKASLVDKFASEVDNSVRKAEIEKQVKAFDKQVKADMKDMEKSLAGAPGSGVKMIPFSHIHMRCQRYMVKQFLGDFHTALYQHTFGKEPPAPYAIAILGHAHQRGETFEEGKARWAARNSAK